MARKSGQWSLQDLIDFEHEIAANPCTTPAMREAVAAASSGLDGTAARQAGLRVWLDMVGDRSAGGKFISAVSMLNVLLAALMGLLGMLAVFGMLDRERAGLHVLLFLAILIGGQWLVLLLVGIGCLARGRTGGGTMGILLGNVARKIAGGSNTPWWDHIVHHGGPARDALLWRLARMTQTAGIFFNIGLLGGLAGLVLLRHVGFFWETTTDAAMRDSLQTIVGFLSSPWAAWLPGFVPDAEIIAKSRWIPNTPLAPGPAEWWRFLLLTTVVWGLLPRLLLWLLAWKAGHKALASLDFQSRAHRALWRELTASERVETDDKAMDGALVLDVGGSGLGLESMRPYLLRRLRVHPVAWHPVAVMDPGAEAEAARALTKAPAGVVLLAEGWSLSPPRMTALHARIRAEAGPRIPVRFLIANSGADQQPLPPTAEERREWERFVDSLRDPEAEVCFFEQLQPL